MATTDNSKKADTSKNSSNGDLAAHFSELAGRKDQYDVRQVEGVDGTKQTQLIDKTTGSISAVFEGDVDVDKIVGSVTATPAVNPKESVEDNEDKWTSTGVKAVPTQPEAVQATSPEVEIDNTDKSVVASDATAETTKSQRATRTQREQ